jgi:uncharacterized protein (DUF697 family)
MTRNELDLIRAECRTLVRRRALVSAGIAVLPVPLLDVVVDAGILLDLIPEISQRFGLAPDRIDALDDAHRQSVWRTIRQRGSQLIGIVVTRQLVRASFQAYAGRIIALQIAKFIPLGGQLVAAGLGYFVMRQLAYKHVEDCYAVALAALD